MVGLSRIGRHKFYRQCKLSSLDRIRSTTATTNNRRLEFEGRNGILFEKDSNSAIALAPIAIEPSARPGRLYSMQICLIGRSFLPFAQSLTLSDGAAFPANAGRGRAVGGSRNLDDFLPMTDDCPQAATQADVSAIVSRGPSSLHPYNQLPSIGPRRRNGAGCCTAKSSRLDKPENAAPQQDPRTCRD